MAMRHVRQREYRKRCLELDAHLNRTKVSKVEKVILIVSKLEAISSEIGSAQKQIMKRSVKRSRDTLFSDYGISVHGREKRRGKSRPVRELLDYCPSKFNKLV
ncbi:hypothetical protein [Citrobacter sp. NCU1]|uniref:hypothetical protein n=1 Tax=Citrobacter sp. NCU1 TaxID=2026683 RepID=UPI001EE25ED1|nr:hypothetical protein [Citrobacter sp. NCU1]